MNEDVLVTACTGLDFIAYEAHAAALEAIDCGSQIWNAE